MAKPKKKKGTMKVGMKKPGMALAIPGVLLLKAVPGTAAAGAR